MKKGGTWRELFRWKGNEASAWPHWEKGRYLEFLLWKIVTNILWILKTSQQTLRDFHRFFNFPPYETCVPGGANHGRVQGAGSSISSGQKRRRQGSWTKVSTTEGSFPPISLFALWSCGQRDSLGKLLHDCSIRVMIYLVSTARSNQCIWRV